MVPLELRLLSAAFAVALLACGEEQSRAPHAVRPAGHPSPDEDAAAGRGTADDPGAAMDAGTAVDSGAPGNPLLGSWLHQVGDCTYTDSFDDEGNYREVATTGEVMEAIYELAPPTDTIDRWLLSFTIISDNNVVDCEGQQNDETGASHSAYLMFVGDDRVDVYPGAETASPGFTWTRQ